MKARCAAELAASGKTETTTAARNGTLADVKDVWREFGTDPNLAAVAANQL
ncbi:MAG: hypothetical protein ACKVLM_14565 [Pseudomonadales bacterium]